MFNFKKQSHEVINFLKHFQIQKLLTSPKYVKQCTNGKLVSQAIQQTINP